MPISGLRGREMGFLKGVALTRVERRWLRQRGCTPATMQVPYHGVGSLHWPGPGGEVTSLELVVREQVDAAVLAGATSASILDAPEKVRKHLERALRAATRIRDYHDNAPDTAWRKALAEAMRQVELELAERQWWVSRPLLGRRRSAWVEIAFSLEKHLKDTSDRAPRSRLLREISDVLRWFGAADKTPAAVRLALKRRPLARVSRRR